MKFYRLNEIPIRSDDRVFKASTTRAFLWTSLFFGVGIALLLVGHSGAKIHGLNLPPNPVLYYVAAIFGLLGWFAWGIFRDCMMPTNWLLRCNNRGVIIKYRSFENWRCPAEDVQAVGFDYSEVAWIRTVSEWRTAPGLGGGQTKQIQHLTYLDFCLVNKDTAALEAYLQAEQKAEPPGRFKTICRDYRVEVLPDGIVRLRWRSDGYRTRPSTQTAVEYLSRHVKTNPAESTKVDLTRQSILSPEDGDANILKLARSGDTAGAVKLTRELYGFTLSEAVAFVEKLKSGS